MNIAGMVRSSLADYPGKVACVLFLPGCGYDCFYCHNRALIDRPAERISAAEIFDFLRKRTGLLDGVVVTGGEPTLQPGLSGLLAEIHALGFPVKLDTNGSEPGVVAALLGAGLCDYVAVDCKAPRARYREFCGPRADADAVFETIRLLKATGVAFEVRTTVVPQLGLPDLLEMASELPPLPRYVLNRYRPPELFKPADRERVTATPHTQAEIDAFAAALRAVQPGTVTGVV